MWQPPTKQSRSNQARVGELEAFVRWRNCRASVHLQLADGTVRFLSLASFRSSRRRACRATCCVLTCLEQPSGGRGRLMVWSLFWRVACWTLLPGLSLLCISGGRPEASHHIGGDRVRLRYHADNHSAVGTGHHGRIEAGPGSSLSSHGNVLECELRDVLLALRTLRIVGHLRASVGSVAGPMLAGRISGVDAERGNYHFGCRSDLRGSLLAVYRSAQYNPHLLLEAHARSADDVGHQGMSRTGTLFLQGH